MQVGWCSRNSNTGHMRTVSAALYNMAGQLSNITSSNINRRDGRPEYRQGNQQLVAIISMNLNIYLLAKEYYV